MSLKIDILKEQILSDPNVTLDPNDWEIGHHFADGLYAKEIRLPAGSVAIQHCHDYDHLSVLAFGEAVVTFDDEQQTLKAPACITIKKGKNHGIQAVTDITWYCIHNEEVALWPCSQQ